MSEHILMDGAAINRTLTRLSHEVVEKAKGAENLCLIGIPRRGEIVAARVRTLIEKFYGASLPCAGIDFGMYRDDLVSGYFVPDARKRGGAYVTVRGALRRLDERGRALLLEDGARVPLDALRALTLLP